MSLRTRCRIDALKKSRKLIVFMDDLAKKYFIDPEAYGKAMELLMIDENMFQKSPTFEEFDEHYLSNLDQQF